MRTIVRTGLFETNSSSTHSITLATEDSYKLFKNGEVLLDDGTGCFISREDAWNKLKEEYKKYNTDFKASIENLKHFGDDEDYTASECLDDYPKDVQDLIIYGLSGHEIANYEQYIEDEGYLETYVEHHKINGTDMKVVALGKYGYDG